MLKVESIQQSASSAPTVGEHHEVSAVAPAHPREVAWEDLPQPSAEGIKGENVTVRLDPERQKGVASQLAALSKTNKVVLDRYWVTPEQQSALMGRVTSGILRPWEEQAIDTIVEAGQVDEATIDMLGRAVALFPQHEHFKQRVARVAAVIHMLTTSQERGLSEEQEAFLVALTQSDPGPYPEYYPVRSQHDGDFENAVYDWLQARSHQLLVATAEHHPLIPEPSMMWAAGDHADEIAASQGKFLEDFNVLTFMHTMGRTPPWLRLLTDKLGLDPESYYGISVPYSESKISALRANLDGYETVPTEGPTIFQRVEKLKKGDLTNHYEDSVLESLRTGFRRMAELHEKNGKPIMVVDDTGLAAQIAKEEGMEDIVRIVGWTKRTTWLYDDVENAETPFLAAGSARPKVEIEPPFIAAGLVEHIEAIAQERLGTKLGDLKVTVVGQGDVGATVTKMLARMGVKVVAYDSDETVRGRVQHENVTHANTPEEAVKDADIIVPITGDRGMPGDLREMAKKSAIIVPGSSSDVEVRKEDGGYWHWSRDVLEPTFEFDPKDEHRREEITDRALDMVLTGLEDALAEFDVSARVTLRQMPNGGFVANLSRRIRETPLKWEELILMIMTEAMAQIAESPGDGSQDMEARREDRIERIFHQVYLQDWAWAMNNRPPPRPQPKPETDDSEVERV